jgi:hypothetical protein
MRGTKKASRAKHSAKFAAVETLYDGYHFRSRLEARWAVVFNFMGVAYQYEPFSVKYTHKRRKFSYWPDFVLEGVHFLPYYFDTAERKGSVFMEVKHREYPATTKDISKWRALKSRTQNFAVAKGLGYFAGDGVFGVDDMKVEYYNGTPDNGLQPFEEPLGMFSCPRCNTIWLEFVTVPEWWYCPLCTYEHDLTAEFNRAYEASISHEYIDA